LDLPWISPSVSLYIPSILGPCAYVLATFITFPYQSPGPKISLATSAPSQYLFPQQTTTPSCHISTAGLINNTYQTHTRRFSCDSIRLQVACMRRTRIILPTYKKRGTMINQVILVGNVGADPEQRQANNGSAVTNFSIATSRRWKGTDGQMQDETDWHRIVAFGRLAEVCGQYLRKGSKVYIEGRIQTRQWDDRDGNKRYTTEIVAGEMKMLDSRQDNSVKTDREVVPSRKNVVNDWPPPELFTTEKNTLSIADDPFTEAKLPF
jgi:single-strand DNA-binding protein